MSQNEDRFPHPVYKKTVLAVNFEDAKRFFLESFLDIEYAHALMLERQGILSAAEAKTILAAVGSLKPAEIHQAVYDGSHEDLFFFLEARLEEICGRETAGKLHIARSRNDIDITLYRMEIRRRLLELQQHVLHLVRVLTDLAEANTRTVMPAHTHTQPAQPTTLGHYLCAAVEFLLRDAARLRGAYATVNRNPLGACAITTTGFPIDRAYTAQLLSFDGLQVNSYGAIAAVDYILESAAAVSITMVNAGKLIHDLLLWCMQEFSYLRLSDAFVQTSSIMPQKRNPVALEHARVLSSRAHAEAQAVFTTAHNTPFGDIVDSEDDLLPLVFMMFEDAARGLELLSGALGQATFNTERMALLAGARFLTVTELADMLVRSEGISFRIAHELVALAVRENPADDSHQRIVDDVLRFAPEVLGRPIATGRDVMLRALDPVHFVEIRKIEGGPAPERVAEQIGALRRDSETAAQWAQAEQQRLDESRAALRATVR